MGLESKIASSGNVYLHKNLIRSLIRLRLQLSKGEGVSQLRYLSSSSIKSASTSGPKQGQQPLSEATVHPLISRNISVQQGAAESINSSLSQDKVVSLLSVRDYSSGDQSNKGEKNKTLEMKTKGVLAAVVFTSLLIEESYNLHRGKGVLRYDVSQLPSNNPIEDARSEHIVQVPLAGQEAPVNSDWLFFGIYDGHSGYNTSTKLKNELIGSVISELMEVYPVNSQTQLRSIPDTNIIDQAIRSGFTKLDDEIVNRSIDKLFSSSKISKAEVSELLMPLLSGSCALLSFYDTHSQTLKVAVTGDSRALLGSLTDDNKWTVEQLSVDQTGSNPAEVSRMNREHPKEPEVIRRGRVLGSLEPTRSFGDARYKWSQKIQDKIYKQFFGRRSPPGLLTPPYVTADPVITTTKIDPSKDKFLVMASDGLYEMLTNEEIVGLVVRWMENEQMVDKQEGAFGSLFNLFSFGKNGTDTNKLPEVIDLTATPESSKQAFRRTNKLPFSYLLEDTNVSTHLIRNALSNGGSNEHCEMLASIPSPLSRRYRDDLTVTVVFFGEDGTPNDMGKLELNLNATNEKGGNVAPKPKL